MRRTGPLWPRLSLSVGGYGPIVCHGLQRSMYIDNLVRALVQMHEFLSCRADPASVHAVPCPSSGYAAPQPHLPSRLPHLRCLDNWNYLRWDGQSGHGRLCLVTVWCWSRK